jgi:hypothetical protein
MNINVQNAVRDLNSAGAKELIMKTVVNGLSRRRLRT